ncbi:MAG: hypothetical protein KGL39_04625 [Patescibacteria group bacterium]|nr:hypothetical protein [Patescibacteria group bacterium]
MNDNTSATLNPQYRTAARYLLFFAGTWLATHGYIANADVNELVSAILIIAPPIWAFVENNLAKKNAVVAQTTAVNAALNLAASGNMQTVTVPGDGVKPVPATATTAAQIVHDYAPK